MLYVDRRSPSHPASKSRVRMQSQSTVQYGETFVASRLETGSIIRIGYKEEQMVPADGTLEIKIIGPSSLPR